MKVFISESAFKDLEGIKEYYEKEGVSNVGEKYVTSLVGHIQSLSNNPDIGRKVPEFDNGKIIELIHPPFRIVYLREESSIHIIRVWRSERLLLLPENEV